MLKKNLNLHTHSFLLKKQGEVIRQFTLSNSVITATSWFILGHLVYLVCLHFPVLFIISVNHLCIEVCYLCVTICNLYIFVWHNFKSHTFVFIFAQILFALFIHNHWLSSSCIIFVFYCCNFWLNLVVFLCNAVVYISFLYHHCYQLCHDGGPYSLCNWSRSLTGFSTAIHASSHYELFCT